MRTPRCILLTAALVAAMVAPTQAAASAGPTVPEYAALADGICRSTVTKHGKTLAAFGQAVRTNQRRRGYRLGKKVVRALKSEYRRIKALPRPNGQQANVAKWLQLKGKSVKVTAKLPRVFLKRGRAAGRRYAAKADRYLVRAKPYVAAFPFKVCS